MEAVMVTEGRIVIEHNEIDYIFAVYHDPGRYWIEEEINNTMVKVSSKNLKQLVINLQGALKKILC